jgi:hypothetical protein
VWKLLCLSVNLFEHEAFRSGNFDTHFVKKYYSADLLKNQLAQEAEIAMIALNNILKIKNCTTTQLII